MTGKATKKGNFPKPELIEATLSVTGYTVDEYLEEVNANRRRKIGIGPLAVCVGTLQHLCGIGFRCTEQYTGVFRYNLKRYWEQGWMAIPSPARHQILEATLGKLAEMGIEEVPIFDGAESVISAVCQILEYDEEDMATVIRYRQTDRGQMVPFLVYAMQEVVASAVSERPYPREYPQVCRALNYRPPVELYRASRWLLPKIATREQQRDFIGDVSIITGIPCNNPMTHPLLTTVRTKKRRS